MSIPCMMPWEWSQCISGGAQVASVVAIIVAFVLLGTTLCTLGCCLWCYCRRSHLAHFDPIGEDGESGAAVASPDGGGGIRNWFRRKTGRVMVPDALDDMHDLHDKHDEIYAKWGVTRK